MKKILFVCTGNSARSQMAEGFARAYGRDRVRAASAGVEPRDEIEMLVRRLLDEIAG